MIEQGSIINATGTLSFSRDTLTYAIKNIGAINECGGNVYTDGSSRTKTAIYNTGTITVTGGKIGINESNQTEISQYGVNNNATFNFYGGEIYGSEDTVQGHISAIPEGKEVFIDEETNYTKMYLENIPSALVSIGGNEYNTIGDAISVASSGDTIKLLRSVILVSSIDIPSGKNIIFDLNGNSIESYADEYLINNNGTFKLTNELNGSTSVVESTYGTLNNEGTAEVNAVTIKNRIEGSSSAWRNLILNKGQLDITNIEENINKEYTRLIDNEQGTLTYNSGNVILNANNTRVVYNNANVEINGGTFTSTAPNNVRWIENVNDSHTTIQTATVDFNSAIIYNGINSTLNIEGGNYQATGTEEMIINGAAGNVNITGGTFNAKGTAIINKSTGNVTIDNCTIVSEENNAVYNESTGEITIGNNDGQVSTETPKIVSYTNYGVYNNTTGTIRYCDGQIIGKTGTVYGTLLIPSTHKINQEDNVTEGGVEGLTKITLVPKGDTVAVATVNGINYETLQAAVNVCGNGQSITIILQADITDQSVVQILQGRTITIDLNGHTISPNVEIQNSGSLTIKNTQGTVESGTYGTITGSGTLDIIN